MNEKNDDAIILIDGYKSYLSALENNQNPHLDKGSEIAVIRKVKN